MRQGDVAIEARLDLHGMTQDEAYAALLGFVKQQALLGKRQLLIITGKGRLGGSVLRTSLPKWCDNEPLLAERILALRPAAPKHGGAGAWYVILRRQRDVKE